MEEDDFLVEAARWAGYYEKAYETIGQIMAAQVAESPPQEIIDDPQTFRNWVEQCKNNYKTLNSY